MRFLSLTIGLVAASVCACATIAAEPQQDDKSYLPPAQLRAAPEPGRTTARAARPRYAAPRYAAIEPARKHRKAVHHYRRPRVYHEARYPRFMPGFFFGFF
jgi:hypothetical protein